MVVASPKLAVWKFASCDGCQLSLLDCEDEILELVERVQIAHFLEASSAEVEGPYDISLVEGSITTASDADRIVSIRQQSRILITIGACATAGGVQALRNYADIQDFIATVYAEPRYISTLARSTPIQDHVTVDYELHGCPIAGHQLLEVINALLNGRVPNLPGYSECIECKRNGTVCVMVADGITCLGPVTRAGCGNLCPPRGRGCYGCFGPMETPNTASLARWMAALGRSRREIRDAFRSFNADAPAFRQASEEHD